MLNTQDIIEYLSDLMQLDYDAVKAYEVSLAQTDDREIKMNLSLFRDDHVRHVSDLEAAIRTLGGDPPQRGSDIKGFFIEGFTSARSATGTSGVLEAMETNERITNKGYAGAHSEGFTANIRSLIDANYKDEQNHISYIRARLQLIKAAR